MIGLQVSRFWNYGACKADTVDDINPAIPQRPETMRIMVRSLLWVINAGFMSSTVGSYRPKRPYSNPKRIWRPR